MEEATILIGSSSNVLEPLALPLMDPSCKNIKQICSPPRAHLFSSCMRVELWADPYGINLKCYWECLKENLGSLGNDLETPKEHFENKEKKPKKSIILASPPLPYKKWTPHECMLSLLIGCMKLLFPNYPSPFLAYANSMGTN
jgi:hypothetical protein